MLSVILPLFVILLFSWCHLSESAVLGDHTRLNTSIKPPSHAKSGVPDSDENNDLERPKREKRSSGFGLLSSMYEDFQFNYLFSTYVTSDASEDRYSEVKDYFSSLIDEILEENQLPLLDTPSGTKWQELKDSLIESYDNEKGAIIYDQDYLRWVYCGWFQFNSDNFRMCAPLLPLGLEDIERPAVKNSDYIPKGTAFDLYTQAAGLEGEEEKDKPNSSGSGDTELVSLRMKKPSSFSPAVRDYALIDLFTDSTTKYNDNCVTKTSSSSNCDPMCCYSTYIGSEFCTEEPMRCIYFGG